MNQKEIKNTEIRKEDLWFLSKDGKTRIHGVKWLPEQGGVCAVLQICHGMTEYSERYDEFARCLAKRGFLVVGHDHLGHGASIQSETEWGYFAQDHPSETVVADIYQLTALVRQEYPSLPYFILGHSMGAYLLRRYLTLYSGQVTGAVICGTGCVPELLVRTGMLVCLVLEKFLGGHHRSRFITEICFGGAYKKFEKDPQDVTGSWLSKNKESVRAYKQDKRCTFQFTLNGYYGMFLTISYDNRLKHVRRIRKDLPVLFIAGKDDPVGNFGKGVKKVCRQYRRAGIKDIKLRLYENDRHEILQETDRRRVYGDVYRWMKKHME